MFQQTFSANFIPNSTVGIFSPKTERTKTKAAWALTICLLEAYICPLSNFKIKQ
jgi:hypothetical protein